MQFSYNKFRQVVDNSNEKTFEKIAEAIATSDNAALVAMFDDTLILLDEENEELHLCDYEYKNGVLSMHKFQPVELTENNSTYLDEIVESYFDLDSEETVSVGDLMSGFHLKYKNESNAIFTEAKDRKYKKVIESPRIGALKRARDARDSISEEIQDLLEEPFMQHLSHKVTTSKDSIPAALNKVSFKNPYPVFVNTDIGGPAKDLLILKDKTNVMDAMKGVALKVSEKWKSDSFRKKFEKMVNQILQTESKELGKSTVLSFLDENKELFLLKEDNFNELITKTSIWLGETDTESILTIFEQIMESKEGRSMKRDFFGKYKIDESKLDEINDLSESEGMEVATDEPSKKSGDDLDEEKLEKIISVFKKIKGSMKEDTQEMDYVNGIISSLEGVKSTGIEDSKMKEIIEFLNGVKSEKKEEPKAPTEEPEEEIEL